MCSIVEERILLHLHFYILHLQLSVVIALFMSVVFLSMCIRNLQLLYGEDAQF